MILVIDASVACKWFIEEPGSEAAEALLGDRFTLVAPDLSVPEVCNVASTKLRRAEVTASQAAAMVDGMPDLIGEFVPSLAVTGRALEIASSLAHPVYDCFYLALAEIRAVPFVTADPRFVGRVTATAWAGSVHSLEVAAAWR